MKNRVWIGVALIVWSVFGSSCHRSGTPGEIEITVLKTSRLPDPATSPYSECLLFVQCLQSIGDKNDETVILAFWGFRDGEVTSAVELSPGDRLRVKVRVFPEDELAHVMRADDTDNLDDSLYLVERWEWLERGEQITPSPGEKNAEPELRDGVCAVAQKLIEQGDQLVKASGEDFWFHQFSREIYRPGFWSGKDAQALANGAVGPVEAIEHFAGELAAHGSQLLVVIVPRSATLYPEWATGLDYDWKEEGRIDAPVEEMVAHLCEQGVEVLDLTTPFLERRFFEWKGDRYPIAMPNDGHWSPFGARLAARKIVNKLGELQWIDDPVEFSEESVGELREHHGDYVAFLPEGESLPAIKTPVFPAYAEKEVASAYGFDQPGADVVLLGDSFASIFKAQRASLHDHLVAGLGVPVHAIISMGGVTTSRQTFAREFRRRKLPRLVIWEFSQDFLGLPEMWRTVSLAQDGVVDLASDAWFAGAELEGVISLAPMKPPGYIREEQCLWFDFTEAERGALHWREVALAQKPGWSASLVIGPRLIAGEKPSAVVVQVLVQSEVVAEKRILPARFNARWEHDWVGVLEKWARQKIDFSIAVEAEGVNGPQFVGLWQPRLAGVAQ